VGIVVYLPLLLMAADSQPQPASLEPLSRFWNVRIGDVIMIFAVFLAPLFALWAQWRLQLRREGRDQRIRIFKTLMAARATPLDINHVQSLNMIDVEFSKGTAADTAIRGAWETYRNHLSVARPMEEVQGRQWDDNQRDFLSQLLRR
jgi:hypothetical protein